MHESIPEHLTFKLLTFILKENSWSPLKFPIGSFFSISASSLKLLRLLFYTTEDWYHLTPLLWQAALQTIIQFVAALHLYSGSQTHVSFQSSQSKPDRGGERRRERDWERERWWWQTVWQPGREFYIVASDRSQRTSSSFHITQALLQTTRL